MTVLKCSTNQSALNEDIVQLHGKFLYSIGLVAILFYFAWPFLEAITRWLIHSCQSCFMNKEKEGFGYFCFKTSFWSSAFFCLKMRFARVATFTENLFSCDLKTFEQRRKFLLIKHLDISLKLIFKFILKIFLFYLLFN